MNNTNPTAIINKGTDIDHIRYESHGHEVSKVTVKTSDGARKLNKSIGDYYTIETGYLGFLNSAAETGECLAEILSTVLAPFNQKRLCICGLGNPDILFDSLGPMTVKMLPARFLEILESPTPCKFSKLITVAPNVEGSTNIRTEELVAGIVSAGQADCLILIDACATDQNRRANNQIQLTTAGGTTSHAGREIKWEVVGVPIISIGIPTVISKEIYGRKEMLTSAHIQDIIMNGASVLAYALIRASYPDFTSDRCIEALTIRNSAPLVW